MGNTQVAPIAARPVTQHSLRECDWGIVLNSVQAEPTLMAPFHKSIYEQLILGLTAQFGMGFVFAHACGHIDDKHALIKVCASKEKLEEFAEEIGFLMRSRETDERIPFTRAGKQSNLFIHPMCECSSDTGDGSLSVPQCACCKSAIDDTPIDHDDIDHAVSHLLRACNCELFLPCQRQELVRLMIVKVLDAWTPVAMREKADFLEKNSGKLTYEIKSEISHLREAAARFLPDQGLTLALYHEVVIDVVVLPTLSENENVIPNPFYPNRETFFSSTVLFSVGITGLQSSNKVLRYIRDYFGEKIGLYFSFLHFYDSWLVALSIIGASIATYQYSTGVMDSPILSLYAVIVAVWAPLFLEYWKRKSAAVAFHWDMEDLESEEKELDSYIENQEKDAYGIRKYGFFEESGGWVDLEETAKRLQREKSDLLNFLPKSIPEGSGSLPEFFFCCFSPQRARRLNRATSTFLRRLVSFTVISTLIASVVIVTISLLIFKIFAQQANVLWGGVAAGVVQTVAIMILNGLYRKVAIIINDWENHRTETLYEDALIVKLFLFQFINSYFSLFYIAFIKSSSITWFGGAYSDTPCTDWSGKPYYVDGVNNCLPELATQLQSIMISNMLLSNFLNHILPYLIFRLKLLYKHCLSALSLSQAPPQVEAELLKDTYAKLPNCSGVFSEYNDLVIQFGYVTLFAPAFPLAALLALVTNGIAERISVWKLLFSLRRPAWDGAKDIGSWMNVFEIMSLIAILTNAGIICFTSVQLPKLVPGMSKLMQFAVVVIFEHGVLACKYMIDKFTNDVPQWVRVRLARRKLLSDISARFDELQRSKATMSKFLANSAAKTRQTEAERSAILAAADSMLYRQSSVDVVISPGNESKVDSLIASVPTSNALPNTSGNIFHRSNSLSMNAIPLIRASSVSVSSAAANNYTVPTLPGNNIPNTIGSPVTELGPPQRRKLEPLNKPVSVPSLDQINANRQQILTQVRTLRDHDEV